MKKLVIFDLDGTLVDTIPDIAENVNKTLMHFGFKTRSEKEILGFVNYGAEKLLRDAIGEKIEEELFQNAFSFYKEIYAKSTNEKSKVYNGIYELLDELKEKGTILAVYSNKQSDVVQNIVNSKFKGVFTIVTGQTQGVKTKPDPTYINSLVKELGLDKNSVYMVGDGDTDVLVAKNSGINSVAVSWGYRDASVLLSLGADVVLNSAKEVLEYILKG